MKNLLLTSLLFGSMTTFAQSNISEFERGYDAGRETCTQELWSCSVKYSYIIVGGIPAEEEIFEEGYSRAQALAKLILKDERYAVLVRNGKAVCKKI
jgi:hypothetical protein